MQTEIDERTTAGAERGLGSLVEETDSAAVDRLFGTDPEVRFDRVTMMAASYFSVPIAVIGVVQGDRVWLKSRYGVDLAVAPLRDTLTDAVLASGSTLVLEDASADPRFSGLPTVATPGGMRFFAGRVLRGGGGSIIGIFAIADLQPRAFSDQDRRDLGLIARWVEEEMTREQEDARAAAVQAALLPRAGISVPGYDIAGMCVPARDVGGDFYDWYPTHDGLTFTLADVMGKGVGAAIIASSVRAVLRGANPGWSVASAVSRAAAVLDEDLNGTSSFVTAFHGRLRRVDGSVRYVDAGHGLTIVARADGTVQQLATDDVPLGTTLGERWNVAEIWLEPGDTLVTFSDGVLDLYDGTFDAAAEEVGKLAHAADRATDVTAGLTAAARLHRYVDDVTAVVIRRC
jgi:hypothetical protein